MNDNFMMCRSMGSEIKKKYFVIAMCFESQPRRRQLETAPFNLQGLWDYTAIKSECWHSVLFLIVLAPYVTQFSRNESEQAP